MITLLLDTFCTQFCLTFLIYKYSVTNCIGDRYDLKNTVYTYKLINKIVYKFTCLCNICAIFMQFLCNFRQTFDKLLSNI